MEYMAKTAALVIEIGGAWRRVLKALRETEETGIAFTDSFSRRIGSGADIEFWTDRWSWRDKLTDIFPREG